MPRQQQPKPPPPQPTPHPEPVPEPDPPPEPDDRQRVPKFSMVANSGKVPMRIAGWKFPVILDFQGISIPSQTRPIRLNHDRSQGVGHTDKIWIDEGVLKATGVVSRETPAATDVVASAKKGFPWQSSVGASADSIEFVKSNESVTVNGSLHQGPLNVIRKSTLGEISFVDAGADHTTSVQVAAFETLLINGEKDESPPTEETPEDASAVIGRAKRERVRQEAIRAHVEEALSFRGADVEEIEHISQQATEEGWTAQATELALLRATRPRSPAVRRADVPTPTVLEAALCMNLGISDETLSKDRDYGPEIVQRAWPMRRRGVQGTIAAALEASGVRAPHGRQELFQSAVEHFSIRAGNQGFSTVNLPGILGNVANKILLDAFTAIETTYQLIADQADFSNFHLHSIYRLDSLGDFAQVPPEGEIPHGYLSESTYTNRLATYGQMLTITRQDIINDDLNAFRTLTQQLARKARIAVEKALYTELLEAVDTFFTVARGNRLVGALGVTELAAAEAALMTMTDEAGDPIYATPKYLLVPPALKYVADQLYTSASLSSVTSSQKPTDNPFKGRFIVVSSPYLSSSAITGSSATTWYLLADPNLVPALQVAFLDGRRAPTVETADAAFNTLGMSMRCYWDFGVGELDYRGAVKSTAS